MMPRRVRHVIDAIMAQRDELPQATDSEGRVANRAVLDVDLKHTL
jgi:hypothetical protein